MEAKKSKKADLEHKRIIFIQIGLIISLAIVLYAFEYKTYEKKEIDFGERIMEDVTEEIIPITEQKVEVHKIVAPKTITVINIVDDDVEIEDDIDIDVEADDNTEIEEYVPIEEEEEAEEQEIFLVVESPPSFPGGEAARKRFLGENLKYPQMAKESGIQGKVYVTFVVEPNGSVTGIKIIRGIGGGCDEEAIRVTKLMPTWIAGKQRGKPVRVQFNMPIKFTLQQQ
ncbi:MAG: energy transducer TonB [Bacteroidales bacterium]|nr:energy transducer TonB [Bacteroidales bacterium]